MSGCCAGAQLPALCLLICGVGQHWRPAAITGHGAVTDVRDPDAQLYSLLLYCSYTVSRLSTDCKHNRRHENKTKCILQQHVFHLIMKYEGIHDVSVCMPTFVDIKCERNGRIAQCKCVYPARGMFPSQLTPWLVCGECLVLTSPSHRKLQSLPSCVKLDPVRASS